MEDKNKQFEEFFQNSMDDFSESPSSEVWDSLSQRLDDEKPWYADFRNWMLLLLPLFALSTFYLLYQNSFLKDELLSLNVNNLENLNLSDKNLAYESEIAALTNEINELEKSLTENKEQLNSAKDQIDQNLKDHTIQLSTKNNEINRLIQENRQSNRIANNSNSYIPNADVNGALKTQIASLENEISKLKQDLRDEQMRFELYQKSIVSSEKELTDCDESMDALHLDIQSINDRIIAGDFRSRPNFTMGHARQIPSLKIQTALPFDEIETSNTRTDYTGKVLSYRFGPSGRYFNTFVSSGTGLNPAFSWGMRQELRVLRRLSLTSNVHFNQQTYEITQDGNSLNRELIEKYSRSLDEEIQVKGIHSKNEYFDATLGLKFLLNRKPRKFKSFIEASAVWQLYLPQEFQFDLVSASDLIVSRNTYLGYLGSANLSIGIEQRLTRKLHFQLCAYMEQSFIPLGYEQQYMNIVGLSSRILIGR